MDSTSENSRIPNKAPDACGECELGFECGKLKMALLFLEGQQESCTGSRRKQEIKDLLDKIKATGFDYPTARKSCQLIDNKEKIRLFTEEAIDMVYQKVLAQWKKQI